MNVLNAGWNHSEQYFVARIQNNIFILSQVNISLLLVDHGQLSFTFQMLEMTLT